MKIKKLLSALMAGMMLFSLPACVNQHPEEGDDSTNTDYPKLVATSPAVAQICNQLNLI